MVNNLECHRFNFQKYVNLTYIWTTAHLATRIHQHLKFDGTRHHSITWAGFNYKKPKISIASPSLQSLDNPPFKIHKRTNFWCSRPSHSKIWHQIKPKKIITVKGIEWHLWWCLIILKIVLEKTLTQKKHIKQKKCNLPF